MDKFRVSEVSKLTLVTLGDMVRAARKARGFSQSALAERLGVDRRLVMSIEKGSNTVSIGVVFEACYILGIPLLADDPAVLSTWQRVLSDFSAVLPRSKAKRKDFDDDF